jgi:hypothetical protein
MDSKNDLMLILERFLQEFLRIKEQQIYLIENIKINRVLNFQEIFSKYIITLRPNDPLHFDNSET